jgi:hypothetical protein
VASAGLVVTTSSSVTVTDAVLSAVQYGNVGVVSTNEIFNISATIVDQITKIQLGNIQWGSFTWTAVVSLYTSVQYQASGTLVSTASSVVIVNPTTGIITATNLAITKIGMYILQILLTSTNNAYSISLTSNGILVKDPSSK